MSTPRGKRGFFYDSWAHGGDLWHRVTVRATDCPRISRSFIEEERRVQGPAWFRQEYLCEFEDDEAGMFNRALVENALNDKVRGLGFNSTWEDKSCSF